MVLGGVITAFLVSASVVTGAAEPFCSRDSVLGMWSLDADYYSRNFDPKKQSTIARELYGNQVPPITFKFTAIDATFDNEKFSQTTKYSIVEGDNVCSIEFIRKDAPSRFGKLTPHKNGFCIDWELYDGQVIDCYVPAPPNV